MSRPRAGPFPRSAAKHWAPLLFVIIVLLGLVGIPIVSERRVRAYEQRLNDLIEPARAATTVVYLTHGIASGALREYAATGTPEARARYESAMAREQEAVESLRPLVDALSGTVRDEYEMLRATVDRWREEWAEMVAGARPPDAAMLIRSDLDEQAVIAAARLDRELAREGERVRMEVRQTRRNDVLFAWLLLALALAAAGVVGWAGRRMHRAAAAAERAREDLERVNESRARLIRGFSHDVKNPLGAADGFAQLLEDGLMGPLAPDQMRGIARLRGALSAALGLIDDLVDLARAETGRIDMQLERFDIAGLVGEMVDEYSAAAEAKQQSLRFADSEVPILIESDRPRVRQILSNLFSNAVKYTQEGGSIVAQVTYAEARREPDPSRWIVVAVEDDGPGIPRERQHLIFREFTRLDPAAGSGAGLGLAISQGLAHALGGRITLSSEAGRGSTFRLWLPERGSASRSSRDD